MHKDKHGRPAFFSRGIEEQMIACRVLLDGRLIGPALTIIYCTIDNFAYLDADDGAEEATGANFKKWCRDYLLPSSSLNCSESDLWAARCAVVHTLSPSSRDTRKGNATPVWYAYGNWTQDGLQAIIEDKGWNAVAVSVDALFDALVSGASAYAECLARAPVQQERAHRRLTAMFSGITSRDMQTAASDTGG